TLENNQE
ncbi:Electron transport complex protein RnfC, partial [Haemophilus influenzae]